MSEVDLSEIPSDVVRAALCEIIEKHLNTNKYKVNVSSASKVGENNFIGIIYRILFHKIDDNEKHAISQLILKTAPQSITRRNQFFARPTFVREIITYDTILPTLRKFEQLKGIENGFTEYPKCYRTIDVDLNECLFFEDLSVRGFTIINRRTEDVTADHVYLVMKTLGKFHAISFALKDQQPEKFNELASMLSEIFVRREDDHLREFFNKQSEFVFKSVSGEEDAELLAKAKKMYERDVIDVAADCIDLKLIGSATVITHGDAWQNNIMFRYDNGGKPIEISFLDWQTTRHASPIMDLVYFMFCCTTKKLRDVHYDDFLKVYHESLSAHMRKLGSDPEKHFPYALMLEHFRKFGKFGLILSTVVLPMMTADDGNGINLDEIAENMKNGKEIDNSLFISENSRSKFLTRLRDVVADMARLGYI